MENVLAVSDTITARETMTSVEIAEVTGKEHKSVMRDIRTLSEQVTEKDGYRFVPMSYKDIYGREQPMFELGKKECLLLASGYDAILRAKIINRWEQLEIEKRNGVFEIPQTFADALMLAAKQAKEIEENQKLIGEQQLQIGTLNNKVVELQEKSDYVEKILQSKETITVTQIAQDYGMSAKAFNLILRNLGIQHKVNRQWILYSKYISEGYVYSHTINIVRSDGRPDTVMNTEWRQKGRLFLYDELKKHGYLPLIEQ